MGESDDSQGVDGQARQGPIVHDRRRLDPETGKVRAAYAAVEPTGESNSAAAGGPPVGEAPVGEAPAGEAVNGAGGAPPVSVPAADGVELEQAQTLAQSRLEDLQRLQAEFVNYRRRVERDRDVARDAAVAAVLEAVLPVLDDIHLARQHGDLEGGPFAAIADKLDLVLTRFGLVRYGEPGEAFDPTVHEALVHTQAELAQGTTQTTVVQILQPGYRAGDRVLRAARVAVADPA